MTPDDIKRALEALETIAGALCEQREQLEHIANILNLIYKYGLNQ